MMNLSTARGEFSTEVKANLARISNWQAHFRRPKARRNISHISLTSSVAAAM